MHAEDIMISDFPVVPEDATLQQAASVMAEHGTPVVGVRRGERIVGSVSHRDLAIGGCGAGRDPHSTAVAEVMTAHTVAAPVHAELLGVLGLMRERGLEAVFVGAVSERPVGLLTREQVLEALALPDDRPRGPDPEHVKRVRGDPI